MFKIVFHSFNFPQAEIMIIRNFELEQFRPSSALYGTVKKTDWVGVMNGLILISAFSCHCSRFYWPNKCSKKPFN
jgi:hypothetical protein